MPAGAGQTYRLRLVRANAGVLQKLRTTGVDQHVRCLPDLAKATANLATNWMQVVETNVV